MLCVFFFNDTATTEIYTLSLHDALPISRTPTRSSSARCHGGSITPMASCSDGVPTKRSRGTGHRSPTPTTHSPRSEEHTSELQSRQYLVCRLLLEKKKKNPLA